MDAGYGGLTIMTTTECDCHDEAHDMVYSCPCVECRSEMIDIIHDQQMEREMWPDL